MIAQLAAAAKSAKFNLERTTATSTNKGDINIPTETFDLIDSDNRWQGAVTLFPNGMVMVEKGGKFNWTERFESIYAFKKYLLAS
jgi:hypothetical protein